MAEGYKFHGKTQIRKWLKEGLKDLCKVHGFKVGTVQGCPTALFQETNNYLAFDFFFISSDDLVSVGNCYLRINEIENKLSSILGTDISHHTMILTDSGFPKFRIISEIEITRLISGFTEIFINQHLPFIEKYSDNPKAVLELWDSLDASGRAHGFYDPNMYAKILIASKLVGENKFDQRIEEGIVYFGTRIEAGKSAFIERKENFLKVAEYLKKES